MSLQTRAWKPSVSFVTTNTVVPPTHSTAALQHPLLPQGGAPRVSSMGREVWLQLPIHRGQNVSYLAAEEPVGLRPSSSLTAPSLKSRPLASVSPPPFSSLRSSIHRNHLGQRQTRPERPRRPHVTGVNEAGGAGWTHMSSLGRDQLTGPRRWLCFAGGEVPWVVAPRGLLHVSEVKEAPRSHRVDQARGAAAPMPRPLPRPPSPWCFRPVGPS